MEWYLQVLLRSPHGGQRCPVVHLAINAVDVVDQVSNAHLGGRVIKLITVHFVLDSTFFSVDTTDVKCN